MSQYSCHNTIFDPSKLKPILVKDGVQRDGRMKMKIQQPTAWSDIGCGHIGNADDEQCVGCVRLNGKEEK